jgi:Asp-tRNA(Asn)/Glu-tRNA(Gln) amidotransferase A subunit family amidase
MLDFESLPDLADALRSGRLRLGDYAAALEARFADVAPALQAFMPEPGRFDRLRAEAAALEAAFPDPAARPPLFGVPVGVKDIFHVDGLPTTGGSKLPPEVLAGPEAESVTALRWAGALILGKTVSTEFAYFGPGPTRNPHGPSGRAHTPGGSSSGSAAAVAAGLCPVALGTQTIGSIVRPAAFCGVLGYKPSFGRISTAGVIPLSPSLDHVGLFAPDGAGVTYVAEVLVRDWKPVSPRGRPVFGVPEGPYLSHAGDEAQAHFSQVIGQLEAVGYTLQRVPALPDFEVVRARHNLIVAAEAAQVHADWYARYGGLYHPKTVELIERGQAVTATELSAALAGREQLRAELTRLMEEHGLDAWLAPSAPGPAPEGLDSTGDPVMNLPWTHSGLPAVNVPTGRAANGLPLGTQVIGRWHDDEALLAWSAAHIQRAIGTANAHLRNSTEP